MNGVEGRTRGADQEARGRPDQARVAALADRCHRLVRFLREQALASAPAVTDIADHPLVLWLDDLPDGLALSTRASPGEVVLAAPATVTLPPAPALPEVLRGWVEEPPSGQVPVAEPSLREVGPPGRGGRRPHLAEMPGVNAAYGEWLPAWRIWAARARAEADRRALHGALYGVAQRLAQEGDTLELVLATGLLTWRVDGPNGTRGVRQHLLVTRLAVEVDRTSAAVRLLLPADATTQLDDATLLAGVRGFHPERTNGLHEQLRGRAAAPLAGADERLLREWLTLATDVRAEGYSPTWAPPGDEADRPRITYAPALVLRHRGRAALLTYYDRMLAAPGDDELPPLGLVQLVETLDADARLDWLAAQGVDVADALGDDPLFPLPANPEQARVLRRLAADSGVVVEGPPGTGKTHTIANLVAALLAQGQRVLVTSQKAQALRVLREKLPPDLRRLCVSLTDTADSAPSELAASIGALAAQKAAHDPAESERRIADLAERREQAQARQAELTERVLAARQAETRVFPESDVAPGWSGTRAAIAARLRAEGGAHGWLGPPPGGGEPPLSGAEALELLDLLRGASPARTARLGQTLPVAVPIVTTDEIARMLDTEHAATQAVAGARAALGPPTAPGAGPGSGSGPGPGPGPAAPSVAALTDALARLPAGRRGRVLAAVDQLTAALAATGRRRAAEPWVGPAVADTLAGRGGLLWETVAAGAAAAAADAAAAIRELGARDVRLPPLAPAGERDAAELLALGRALADHLAGGGRLRGSFRSRAQKDAAPLLESARVDGAEIDGPEALAVVLTALAAEAALATGARVWAPAGVEIAPGAPAAARAARLADLAAALADLEGVRRARGEVLAALEGAGTGLTPAAGVAGPAAGPAGGPAGELVSALEREDGCAALAQARAAVPAQVAALAATDSLRAVHARYAEAARDRHAPPELGVLAAALAARDVDAYAAANAALFDAEAERAAEIRAGELGDRLAAAHPELAARLRARPEDRRWDARLAALAPAWGWARAAAWLARSAPAADPTDLSAELDAAEQALAAVTAELAGALGWRHCLERMGPEQSAALRAYSDAVTAGGTFTGRYAERYRRAARGAMEIAQTAVPAWIMPIGEVLSTVPAVRHRFDVVIVDEGSQAGLESLFLLWLAPRVIVVGDDRQCTPATGAFEELEPVFARLDSLLPDVPDWLRVAFTPRSSLFSLLRTRFGEVIRLREHFRCMPEIIGWSSAMFYRDAPLVPLRQFGADRLPPLRSTYVPGGATEAGAGGPRNQAEAEALVSQVVACAQDPSYEGRSFGVVVLQGTAQAELVRSELIRRLPAAEAQRRRLRVGTPPDFQGDERDVVFLSMVIAPNTPTISLTRLEYQRRFNVAASRARDQVWLFHSMTPAELDQIDLRHNYLTYVLTGSGRTGLDGSARPGLAPGGPSAVGGDGVVGGVGGVGGTALGSPPPPPSQVRDDIPHPRFSGLFSQRVYRALAERGYAVAPRVDIGGRALDLVVAGGTARLAIECDADVPRAPEALAADFARERQLRRAGWRFWRVSQSAFELDPEAALGSLWSALADAGIGPARDRGRPETGRPETARPETGRPETGHPAAGPAPAGALAARSLGPDTPEPGPLVGAAGWRPIPLSDLEGLDDLPAHRPGEGRAGAGDGASDPGPAGLPAPPSGPETDGASRW